MSDSTPRGSGCRSIWPGLLLILLALTSSAQGDPPVRILVDSIHAHNALQPPASSDAYLYHSIYGFRRAFDYLKAQGVQVEEVTQGVLDRQQLSNCKMLFINLVSADLPPFRVSEISAIKAYLEAGGALMVITDHSNCYYHAYKLLPLLDELGIEARTETACDRAPATLGNGNGWIAITRFQKHPVTEGLHAIAMETAGTVDDRYAVATTSPQSWGDQWLSHPFGEGDSPGFYGNWKQDPGERQGPLGVVLARQVGRGRLVMVADQNMFGDPFINFADNYRLWLNSVAWLTTTPSLADPQRYQEFRPERVYAYDEYTNARFGNGDSSGMYNLFVALGRRFWLFGGDDLSGHQDLVIFAHDAYILPTAAVDGLVKHLQSRHNVIILNQPTGSSGIPSIVTQLASRLGKPASADNQAARVYTWPGCGGIIVVPPNSKFGNNVVPVPEKQPNEQQQNSLDVLIRLIAAAAKPA